MAETQIAKKAALIFTTDASGAKAGLQTFGGQVKQWADKQSQAMGGMFNAALRGGAIGGFLGGSLQGIVQESLKGITEWATGLKGIREDLADTQARLRDIGEAMARNGKAAAEWRGVMLTPGEKAADIDKQFAQLDKDRAKRIEEWKAALNDLERIRGVAGVTFLRGLMGQAKEADDAALGKANAYAEAIRAITAQMEALDAEKKKTLDPTLDPKLKGSITSSTLAIEQQITTWGLAGDAAQRAIFKANGATEDMLKSFDAANAEMKRLGEQSTPPWLTATLAATDQIVGRAMEDAPAWLGIALNAAAMMEKAGDRLTPKAEKFTMPDGNAALQRGSSAEISARIRYETGQGNKDQLAEARRANTIAAEVRDAVIALPAKIAPALIPF